MECEFGLCEVGRVVERREETIECGVEVGVSGEGNGGGEGGESGPVVWDSMVGEVGEKNGVGGRIGG